MIVIDGSHTLSRSKYVAASTFRPKLANDEELWQPICFLFIRMLITFLTKYKSENEPVVVAWDSRPYLREAWYPNFKGWTEPETEEERKEQEYLSRMSTLASSVLEEWLPKINIMSLRVEQSEADDIGYVLGSIAESGTFCTEDLDWMRSLRSGWQQYRPVTEELLTFDAIFDPDWYGIDKADDWYEQLIWFTLLVGGKGAPGVHGVGWGTARSLSRRIMEGTLREGYVRDEKVTESLEELRSYWNLVDFRATATYLREPILTSYAMSRLSTQECTPETWINLASYLNSTILFDKQIDALYIFNL